MNNLIAVSAVVGSFAFSSLVQAVVIADFGFDSSSVASSTTVPGITTSDLSAGPGIPLGFNAGSGVPAPSLQFSFGDVGANLAASVTDEDYFSFTITPVSSEVTFNSFQFDFFKTTSAGANVQAVLFSSIDGFAVGDQIGFGQLTGTGDSGSFQARSIDLSALPDDITTPVEFRLYIHDSGASNQANQFRLDNLQLDATVVAIPEPVTGLMIFLALPFVARRRR